MIVRAFDNAEGMGGGLLCLWFLAASEFPYIFCCIPHKFCVAWEWKVLWIVGYSVGEYEEFVSRLQKAEAIRLTRISTPTNGLKRFRNRPLPNTTYSKYHHATDDVRVT